MVTNYQKCLFRLNGMVLYLNLDDVSDGNGRWEVNGQAVDAYTTCIEAAMIYIAYLKGTGVSKAVTKIFQTVVKFKRESAAVRSATEMQALQRLHCIHQLERARTKPSYFDDNAQHKASVRRELARQSQARAGLQKQKRSQLLLTRKLQWRRRKSMLSNSD